MHTGPMTDSPDSPQRKHPGWRRLTGYGLLLAVMLLSALTPVDRYAEREYEALFQRALISFAVARTLNGLISAVQGTELALQPAGVGVTLTPGEILDPVNDLVERFSWIMLGATISLGVQQVLLDVGQWWGTRLAVVLVGLAWLIARMRRQASGRADGSFMRVLARVLVLMLFIRFAVPVTMIVNESLYRLFLEERYLESSQVIESAGEDLGEAVDRAEPGGGPEGDGAADAVEQEEPGFLDSLGRSLSGAGQALDFQQRLARMQQRAAEVIEHLIQLSVVFILQTGLLPIAFLWIFLQLAKKILRSDY